jgi:hypothetical protein
VENIWAQERRSQERVKKNKNEKFNDMHSSRNTFRVIKSRRMRWTVYVARMGERGGVYRALGISTVIQ